MRGTGACCEFCVTFRYLSLFPFSHPARVARGGLWAGAFGDFLIAANLDLNIISEERRLANRGPDESSNYDAALRNRLTSYIECNWDETDVSAGDKFLNSDGHFEKEN